MMTYASIHVICHVGPYAATPTGRAKKRSHFVLRLANLQVLTTSAPNLAQINAVFSLSRNLLETTLEIKWRHLSNHSNPGKHL